MNFSGAAGYHKDDLGIELFYSHFQTELGILRGSVVGSVADLDSALKREPPQYTRDFTYSIESPRQEVSHDLAKLNVHKHVGANYYRVQYGFQANARKEFDVRPGRLNDIASINLRLYTQTLDAEWEHTGTKLIHTVGINGMMQDNNNIFGTERIPFIPNFNNFSVGAFLVEKLTMETWTLDAGVRYDYRHYYVSGYDSKNIPYNATFDFYSPTITIGATHRFNKAAQFITSLGSTSRPPHVAELYSFGRHQSAAAVEYGLMLGDTTSDVRNIHDVKFKNERALKWANTYRYQKDKFSFEITGYYNYIFNYIYLRPEGVQLSLRSYAPYLHYRQTNASFLGSDITTSYAALPALKLDARASILRVTDRRHPSDYIIYIPANRYEFGARYRLPELRHLKNFYVEPRLKFIDKQRRAPAYLPLTEAIELQKEHKPMPDFDFAPAPGSYFLLSMFAGITAPFEDSSLDLRVGVTNALNEKYRDYSNRMRYFADEIGRNFTVAVKYSF